MQTRIENLKKAEYLIRKSISDDLRTDIQWLRHARVSLGYLKDAIKELEKLKEVKSDVS